MSRRGFLGGLSASALACGTEAPLADPLVTMRPEPRAPVSAPTPDVHPALGPIDDLGEVERKLYVHPEAFAPLGEAQKNGWRDRVSERGQTFADYLVSAANRPDTTRDRLYLQPLGTFPSELVVEAEYVAFVRSPPLSWLAEYLEVFFGIPTTVLPEAPLDAYRLPVRERKGHTQYQAEALLRAVSELVPEDAYSMTTLIHRDMFVFDEQEYAFGYGLHRDRQAVLSFAQFDPQFLGQARPDTWLGDIDRRSLAVLSHEVAHTFGMLHCTYFACVLNGVSHPQEVDATPLHLCPVCLRKLSWITGFDPLERYRRLQAFYEAADLPEAAGWVARRLDHARPTRADARSSRYRAIRASARDRGRLVDPGAAI